MFLLKLIFLELLRVLHLQTLLRVSFPELFWQYFECSTVDAFPVAKATLSNTIKALKMVAVGC